MNNIKKSIRNLLSYYEGNDRIYLDGNEYIIGEELFKIMLYIKKNNYIYKVEEFPGTQLENNLMLYVLRQFFNIEWGTSIRLGWIDEDNREIFDLFLLLLEKDFTIVNLSLDIDGYLEEFDSGSDEQINYILNMLNSPSQND